MTWFRYRDLDAPLHTYGKKLKEFTDDELFDILQINDKVQLSHLVGICSEVLRRMLEKEREKNGGGM